ncbi:nonstructural protein NSs [Fatsia japonica ringspot-associated virus]|uniref:Nonstructural protein NSs n=1 Tax=Fatsia japonica ringspot-associated virus TaxID=2824867 RepID=A0AAD1NK61_9VIRU|nr:nonstructural protein NSs [Fatsia japonica ringspot-associated virus]
MSTDSNKPKENTGMAFFPESYDGSYCEKALTSYGNNLDNTALVDVYSMFEKDKLVFQSIHATNNRFKAMSSFDHSDMVLNQQQGLKTSISSEIFDQEFEAISGINSTISLYGEDIHVVISHPDQKVKSYKYAFHGRVSSDDTQSKISGLSDFHSEYSCNPYRFVYNPEMLALESETNTIMFPVEKLGTLPAYTSNFGNSFDRCHFVGSSVQGFMSVKTVSESSKRSQEKAHRQLHNKSLKALEIVSRSDFRPSYITKTITKTRKNSMVTIQIQIKDLVCEPEKREHLIAVPDDPLKRTVYCSSECLGQTSSGVSTFIFKIICLDCDLGEPFLDATYFAGALSSCFVDELPCNLLKARSGILTSISDSDRDKINEIICKNLVNVHLGLASDLAKKLNKPVNVFTIKDTSSMSTDMVEVDGKKYRVLKDPNNDYYFTSATFEKTFIGAYKSCQTFIDYCDNKRLSINGDSVFIFN